jgi:DNA-binding Xre family transcriptional regulator
MAKYREYRRVAQKVATGELPQIVVDEKKLYKSLRKKIFDLRCDRGILLEDIAKALGMTYSAAWRMENTNELTIAQLLKLGKLHDMPITDLLEVEASDDEK